MTLFSRASPGRSSAGTAFSCSILRRAWRNSCRSVVARSPRWSAHVRQVISELDELPVINRLKNLEHDRLVRVPRPALIFTQGLEQVILARVGQRRYRLLPGKIRAMAEIAMVLLGERTRGEVATWVSACAT